MKNLILAALLFPLSHPVFSQSLTVYKTDQTSVHFDLAKVDSITFSVTPLAQALDLSNRECLIKEPAVARVDPAAGVFEKVSEGLKIYGSNDQLTKVVHLAADCYFYSSCLSFSPLMHRGREIRIARSARSPFFAAWMLHLLFLI